MKKRLFYSIAAIGIAAGYLLFLKIYEEEDTNTAPKIQFDKNYMELSVEGWQERLLEGVYAYDDTDGDLTEEIIIDSVSEFDREGNRTVKYVVFDKENKAGTAERKISYTDYTPPQIYFTDSLLQDTLSTTKINRITGAVSCVDGDISNNVNIKINVMEDNVLPLTVSVEDSTGTESILNVNYDYDRTLYTAKIVLKDYMINVPVGGIYDFKENIKNITTGNRSDLSFLDMVTVETDLDLNTPGIYEVYYTLTAENAVSARAKAIAVVQ